MADSKWLKKKSNGNGFEFKITGNSNNYRINVILSNCIVTKLCITFILYLLIKLSAGYGFKITKFELAGSISTYLLYILLKLHLQGCSATEFYIKN